ncbi:MAG: hypothetical protein J6R87_04075, partial [Rikenellaceae bacterium]|nr:hypothetical protein [Rikenellaceae bacterium]
MIAQLFFKPLLILSAMLFATCGEQPTPSEKPTTTTPSVEITIGEIGENSITATVTSSNADRAFYAVLPAEEKAPSSGYQLSKHN